MRLYIQLILLIFVIICSSLSYASNFMADYCSIPPFLTQVIYPNVLIILDNSDSMNEFAYKEDYNASKIYYGYFDPNSMYEYDETHQYFVASDRGKWNGNFLNWLTMRRIDLVRKVLTGGKIETNSNYVLIGQIADKDKEKKYNAQNVPYQTPYQNYVRFCFNSTNGQFSVVPYNDTIKNCNDIQKVSSYHSYRVALKVSSQPKGLIQRTWNRMRFGLEVFNMGNKYEDKYADKSASDGGYIMSEISGPGENPSLVNDINNIEPSTWTPLAESLYEAVRYFKGESSAYNNQSYTTPVQYRCQKNFVIIITDGESTKDENIPGSYFGENPVTDNDFNVKDYMDKIAEQEGYYSQRDVTANNDDGTYYLEGVAYYARTNDLLSSEEGIQNLTIYTIFCFDNSAVARDILKKSAKYGAFVDKNGNNKPDLQSEWDEDGDGIADAYFEAQDGYLLEAAIKNVLSDILRRIASGTLAWLLTQNKAKKNLIQAGFYLKKQFEENEIDWIGYLFNYWFYSNPNYSNIREDTISNKSLDICSDGTAGGDLILDFLIDNSTGNLNIKAYESSCDGSKSSLYTTYMSLDELTPVWEAGSKLTQKNATSRKIYTYVNSTEPNTPQQLIELKDLNSSYSYLFGDEDRDGIIDNENNSNGTLIYNPISFENLINYIYGKDISGFRSRKIDGTNTWKLGDIIYSTPKIVEYNYYSVVYVGANDGMLHAFRLGKLRYDGLDAYQDVKLCNDKSNECKTDKLGEELWSYIPKNSLPYLRALADTKYCHLYYVDLMPYIIELDTSNDKKIDKRILIGGMRLGGGVGCNGDNCVNPPLDTCPSPLTYNPATNSCIGLSSYFALDITDSSSPKFLWEFTRPDLGFTYSGPAFIKKDSNYYIMFASGPTNYRGESDQDLKLFVLQLNSNPTLDNFFTISSVTKIDNSVSSTLSSFKKAFGGRLFTEGIDYNNDGNTDMVFLGTTRQSGGTFQGNILGVKITDSNPQNWDIIKVFNYPLGPITAKIEYSKCFDMNYIYFGTGRYFYPDDDPGQNQNDRERLYGVRIDGCLTGDNCNINSAHSAADVCNYIKNDKTTSWYQELDPMIKDQYFKERIISDPTVTDLDVVFFSTTQPTTDVCSFGGRSRIWQLNCATGEDLSNQNCDGYKVNINRTKGKLFLQLSQGNIEQITPGTGSTSSFTGPFTPWRPGITPESPTPFINPNTISGKGKILLWIEK